MRWLLAEHEYEIVSACDIVDLFVNGCEGYVKWNDDDIIEACINNWGEEDTIEKVSRI